MPIDHLSSSVEQQSAEAIARKLLSGEIGCELSAEVVPLGTGVRANVDGINRSARVLCEVYCRIGALRGSQPDKVASDMLKLLLVEKTLGESWRKILCFVDTSAAKSFTGLSWLAAATKQLGFEVFVVSIPSELRADIERAQSRQRMTNVVEAQEG